MDILSETIIEPDEEQSELYTKSGVFVTPKVTNETKKMRLDKYLANCFPEFSRTQMARLITEDVVRLVSNPKKVLSPDDKVALDDVYEMALALLKECFCADWISCEKSIIEKHCEKALSHKEV